MSTPTAASPAESARLELHLDAAASSVEQARAAVGAFLAPHALSPRARYRVELVLEELHTNIVRHGFTPGAAASVRLAVDVHADHVRLEFEDNGLPFDPSAAEPAGLPSSLEAARVGGLGLHLVREAVRQMRYAREAGVNRLVVEIERR